MHRERKRTRSYSSYVALLCDIIDKEPSNYEEAVENKEWKDSMIEEYQSIMKNDVSDVVPRPEGKYVGTRREVCCNFQMDLQDQACCKWKHREM